MTPICFIFVNDLAATACTCVTLDEHGTPSIISSAWEEILPLQHCKRTVVVLSARYASVKYVALPSKAGRYLDAALAFALEEELAQNPEDLFFAHDRKRYHDGKYQVVVVARTVMETLLHLLDDHGIATQVVTIDWFALAENEIFQLDDGNVLAAVPKYHGWLSMKLWQNSRGSLLNADITCQEAAQTLIATRLVNANYINLCQGDFTRNRARALMIKWYKITAGAGMVALLTLFAIDGARLYLLQRELLRCNNSIAELYRQFFPEARQVVNPRLRVEQLLHKGGAGNDHLWSLLSAVGKNLHNFILERMRFQNNILTLDLILDDFPALAQLEHDLAQHKVKVAQKKAKSQDNKVSVTLELKI